MDVPLDIVATVGLLALLPVAAFVFGGCSSGLPMRS